MADLKEPDYLGHRERLRKRFLFNEGRDMPDYELLELLLTIAIPRRDVKPLAKELVRRFKDFAGVISARPEELMQVSGVKENTVVVLKSIKSAAVRLSWQSLCNSDAPVLSNWDELIDYCHAAMAHNDVEEFRTIYLNAKLQVIGEDVHQRGTIDKVAIHPREVIKQAMFKNARGMVLVHNHPSGDIRPSKADVEITKNIIEAARLVNIEVFDHLIIGKSEVFSFRDAGLIK